MGISADGHDGIEALAVQVVDMHVVAVRPERRFRRGHDGVVETAGCRVPEDD